jgi:hypothetical protein
VRCQDFLPTEAALLHSASARASTQMHPTPWPRIPLSIALPARGQRYLTCIIEMLTRSCGANLLRFEDNTADCSAKPKNEHSASYEQLAAQRISLASVSNEWPERFADIMMNDKVGMLILLGCFVIDDHKLGTRVFRHQRESCCGPNDK